MTKILDGKIVRDKIAQELSEKISKLDPKPQLAIVQIGDLPESNSYIRQKKLFGEKIGAIVNHIKLPENVTQENLTSEIRNLNSDSSVHGIIIQMPIPDRLDKDKLIDKILFWKDVDGLSAINLKHLSEGRNLGSIPATTKGILTLLNYYKIPFAGKKVVIVGRSTLVGKPTALALLNQDATVTICHSKTRNLKQETRNADILVVAAGRPKLITKEHVSKGQVVVDVGINVILNGSEGSLDSSSRPIYMGGTQNDKSTKPETEPSGRKLVGDVDFEEVSKIVAAISPVPGGVGPMTVASLFQNLLEAYQNQLLY